MLSTYKPCPVRQCYWCRQWFNPFRPNGGYVIDARGRIWCGDCRREDSYA